LQAFNAAYVYLKVRQVVKDATAAKGMTSKQARDYLFKNHDAELKALEEACHCLPGPGE
jgi:hypothetical protein